MSNPEHTPSHPSLALIRQQFPGLASDDVLLDNAGGSQIPLVVADRIRDYMLNTYAQLGADYDMSRRSTETYDQAHEFVELLMNARGRGRVILGSSTTALVHLLAEAYAGAHDAKRDEIIISEAGHEANVGPWVRLGEKGYRVRWWKVDRSAGACLLDDLQEMLSERTRIVAFPHVSNLLGHVDDARAIVEAAHRVGAKVVVDGVAYAPHRAIDVAAYGADWYAYSTYKVYGPHMAALFGTNEALAELEGPNHFFIPREEVPYKFELGGASHEGCAAILALGEFLRFLAGHAGAGPCTREDVESAYDVMSALEEPLTRRLLEYLNGVPDVKMIGPTKPGPSRVPTISFVHRRLSSREIAVAANEERLGIRYGHFYAYRLCEAMGLEPEDGVVRASCVHYTDPGEIERLIEFLKRTL